MLFETSIDQDPPSNIGHMDAMHYQVKIMHRVSLVRDIRGTHSP